MKRSVIISSLVSIGIIYLCSMIFYPWFVSGGDWEHVQYVWYLWQPFNGGVLAFGAAIVIFWSPYYFQELRKKEKARAARAFITPQLSLISKKCDSIVKELEQILKFQREKEKADDIKYNGPDYNFQNFGNNFFQFFRDCIKFDTKDFGDTLADIVSQIQIHEARAQSYGDGLMGISNELVSSRGTRSLIFDTIKIKATLGKLYPYARGENDVFKSSKITSKELFTAAFNSNVINDGELVKMLESHKE